MCLVLVYIFPDTFHEEVTLIINSLIIFEIIINFWNLQPQW